MQAFWEVVLAIVIVVIGWRLFEGLVSKFDNGETTFSAVSDLVGLCGEFRAARSPRCRRRLLRRRPRRRA
jgi:hypothetical protein